MKIAFMTSGTVNSSMGYRALSLGKELVKKGHEVYIFSPRFDKYSQFKDTGITHIEGVHVMRPFQLRGPYVLGLIPYIFTSLFELLKIRPKIVHIFKVNPITVQGLFAKTIGSKVFVDVDDLDAEVMEIEKNPLYLILLVKICTFWATRTADGLSVVSHYFMKKYDAYKGSKKIVYLPNGAEFKNRGLKKAKKPIKLVFVGNMNRENILKPIFMAAKKLLDKDIVLHIEIIGDGLYLKYFKSLVKKLNLSQVKFYGHQKQKNLEKFLKPGYLGYCYMPNEETTKACSNMKVFQYMQYGVVPIVSNVGDLPYYVAHGKAGYIASYSSVYSLVKTVQTIIKNDKNIERKMKFIRQFGPKNYSWYSLTEKLENAYKEII